MMKNTMPLLLCTLCFALFTSVVLAQETSKKKKITNAIEEEDGPIMFKFEPDFVDKNEKRKEAIARTRSIIDTLDVTERKRLKLLRDLYKNGISRRLQKALLVENIYEEIDE